MRKRSVKTFFDELFWFIVLAAPIIGYFIYLGAYGTNPGAISDGQGLSATVLSFGSFMSNSGFFIGNANPFYQALNAVFGSGGVLNIGNDTILRFLTYFTTVFTVHVLIDILLFIVRIAHKWLSKATHEGD